AASRGKLASAGSLNTTHTSTVCGEPSTTWAPAKRTDAIKLVYRRGRIISVRAANRADAGNLHTNALLLSRAQDASRIPNARAAAATSRWIRCGRPTAVRTKCRGRTRD